MSSPYIFTTYFRRRCLHGSYCLIKTLLGKPNRIKLNEGKRVQYTRYLNNCSGMLPSSAHMDTFFISHGTRTMAIDQGLPARQFLKSWKEKVFKEKPSSILVISAHWETTDPTVNVVDENSTINDFHGVPKQMYQFKYNAPGAPRLALRVKDLLTRSGFNRVKEAKTRGLDHGAWVPLMLMYPEADIPVCQLSVQTKLGAIHHYNMGKGLAPLRDEGVLIIGSGSATHNLPPMGELNGPIYSSRALEFDAWLKESLVNGRHEDINNYEDKAPQARIAHPWPDHFYPLHVALGAAGEKAGVELIHQSWSDDLLSYASYRFTNAAPSIIMKE